MYFFENYKFNKFLSSQQIVKKSVYESEYSLKVDESEVTSKGYSNIVAKLLHEEKAYQEGGYIYIDPYYNSYRDNIWNMRQKKLLSKVKQDNFCSMLNQASIVLHNNSKTEEKTYVYQLSQKEIRHFNCVMTIAALINKNFAYVGENDNIFLKLDYLDCLERKKLIQSDLSHFRTLLGECDNLRDLIALIESCTYKNGSLTISENDVQDRQLCTEIYSLCDLGIIKKINDTFYIDPELASWLLEQVSETSDRVSFVNMYDE